MAEKKTPTLIKSSDNINDIVNEFHNLKVKDFSERITGYEKFHNPKNEYGLKISNHVHDLVMGDSEKGIYHETYKVLDEIAKDPAAKIEKDDVEKIFEQYVDQFLQKTHVGYEDAMKEAEAEGLSPEDLKKMKGKLFEQYHKSEKGSLNPLSSEFIKKYAGESKDKLKKGLQELANTSIQMYTGHIVRKAIGGLIKEEDQMNLYKHIKPKFAAAGYESKDHLLTKSHEDLLEDYTTHLSGGEMGKQGYTVNTQKDDKKE